MKLKILLFIAISLTVYSIGFSKNKIDIKIYGGLAIPNSSFAEFSQDKNIGYFENDTILRSGKIKYVNSNTGYVVGISAITNLSEDLKFTGSIEFCKINTFDNQVFKQDSESDFHPLNVFTTIIPISPGLIYYFLDSDIGAYLKGELSYNMFSYSMNYPIDDVQFNLSNSISESKLGYSIGIGADYFIDKILVSLEYKFKNFNLIGKNDYENTKSAHLLMLGFKFWFNNLKILWKLLEYNFKITGLLDWVLISII